MDNNSEVKFHILMNMGGGGGVLSIKNGIEGQRDVPMCKSLPL